MSKPAEDSTALTRPAEAPENLMASRWLQSAALEETLRALVARESVNPGFGGPDGGERRVLEWAAAWLRQAGLEVRWSEALPGRPNLRARLGGQTEAPALLFETHIDTVSVQNMTIPPFAATKRDGRLWGRGATDAKGQACAMMHALAAWAASGQRPPRPIELALVVDEEHGFGGAHGLLRDGLDAYAGIVIGEPTSLRVVTAHKGTIRWWVRVAGKAAHAARPHLGVNAIVHAAELILEIERTVLPDLARQQAPLLGAPTLSVGMIEGGLQVNLVPPECRFYCDRRTIPGETVAEAGAQLEAAIGRVAARQPVFRAVLEPPTLVARPLATNPDAPLARAARQTVARHGLPGDPLGVDYCTDASVLVAAGRPIVILGPGSIDQAHTADESIDLAQLELGARIYAELISLV